MRKLLCIAAVAAAVFSTAQAADNYQSWGFYRTIVLNTKASGANVGTSGSPAVTHFPVLVRLSGHISNGGNASDSTVMAQSAFSATNGQDIRFSKWDGTHLYFQRERWDASNMYAEFWVLADTVWGGDSVNATNYPGGYLKMYWGNSGAGDSTNGKAVFDTANGFQAGFHMSGPTGSPDSDATINGFNTIAKGGGPHDTIGMIGRSKWFDRVALYDSLPNSVTGKLDFLTGTSYTLSAWVCPDSFPGPCMCNDTSYSTIISKGDKQYNLQMGDSSGGATRWGAFEAAEYTGSNWTTDHTIKVTPAHHWHYVAGTYAGGTVTAFVDGVQEPSSTGNPASGQVVTYGVCIGREPGETTAPYRIWHGMIDEVEMSNVTRSANWIKLCYKNQLQTVIGSGIDSLTIRGPVVGLGITSQPQSQWVVAGANASFTVAAAGMSPITYKWINGTDTVGTASTLTLSAVQASANNSVYRCLVANPLAFVMSNPCTLHVATAPVITSQPANQTVLLGSNASFSVTAIGVAPLSYKWVLSPYNVASDTVGNAATLALSSVQAAADNSIYKCVVANSAGSAVSNPCTLHVLIAPPAPTIVSPAPNAIIKVDSVVFKWNKGGYATTSYMVEVAIDSAMTTILYQNSSLTDTTMTIQFSYALQAYWFRVSAHNSVGWGVFSASQKFTISPSSVAPGGYGAASFALSVNGKDLRYSLPRPGSVCVKLYDVSGREVATLVKGIQGVGSYRAPLGNITAGSYIMTFDAAGLALRKTIVVP